MAKKTKQQESSAAVRNRIKRLDSVRCADLIPNPLNWRSHSEGQKAAMSGILAEVGMVDALLVRERGDGTYDIIDGHMRANLMPDQMVPVLVLDVTEEEATKILLTFDPISAMATANAVNLDALLREVEFSDAALQALVSELAADSGLYDVAEIDAPELASGDRDPFQQMTFTLHDSQVEALKAAMDKAKKEGPFEDSPNENGNGNALARIAEAYCG